jgi:pimeloyl-[acyl-carrier protein] methyl ester esterase
MKRHFIFCHGFGFDKDFWAPLHSYFVDESCTYLDAGYFGNMHWLLPDISSDTQLIGVGHSLGLAKLIMLGRRFEYMIGLNGFIDFLEARRQDELHHFVRKFARHPTLMLEKFHRTCGVTFDKSKYAALNTHKAMADLMLLSKKFHLPDMRTLILSAVDDVITPPNIIHANFDKQQNVTVKMLDNGKHGLGFLKQDVVCANIMEFLDADR